MVTLALVQGDYRDWTSGRTLAAAAVGVAALALLLRRSLTHPVPLIEPAVLRSRPIGAANLAMLIFGESLAIAGAGAAIGIALTFPVAARFGRALGSLFPVFNVNAETLYMQIAAGLIVGAVAALIPCVRAAHIRIVDGLRSMG